MSAWAEGPGDDRERVAIALEDAARSVQAGLVVYRLDRLARDVILQETLLSELARIGARVFSTVGGEQDVIENDPQDPSRKLIRVILGAVAEYERDLIRLRLASGQRRKAEAGGYAAGRPPFGYRAEGKALVEDPAEQATLARMRGLRAAGVSYRQIVAQLAAEGLAPRNGGQWRPSTVQRILGREEPQQ